MQSASDELGGPFDLILGLPVHPLIVHSAVVLVPIVALAAIVMSYLPSFSRRYGKLVIAIAVIAQTTLVAAKLSGESFEERIGKEVERHQNFGDLAPWLTLPMLVLLFIRWRMDREGATVGSPLIRRLVSILLVLAAIAALVIIFLTGHSGAESVWGWVSQG